MCRGTNRRGRRRAWLDRELLLGLRNKRRVYHLERWKKGRVTEEHYRGLIRLCREEVRKAKAQIELRLATVVRHNKKSFYKYINNKKRPKESLHPLLDARGNIFNQWTSSIWIFVKPLTRSPTTPFSPNWRAMDLMGGPFGG